LHSSIWHAHRRAVDELLGELIMGSADRFGRAAGNATPISQSTEAQASY
jgi:hypothetical protein